MIGRKIGNILGIPQMRPPVLVTRRRILLVASTVAGCCAYAPQVEGQAPWRKACYSYQEALTRVYDLSSLATAQLGISSAPTANLHLDWRLAVTIQRQARDTLWLDVTVDSSSTRLLNASPELVMFHVPPTLGQGAHVRGVVSLRTRDYAVTASSADDSLLIPVAAKLFSDLFPTPSVPDGVDTTYEHQSARRVMTPITKSDPEIFRALLATWGVVEVQSNVQGQYVRYLTPRGVSLGAQTYKTMQTQTTIQRGFTIPGTGTDTASLGRLPGDSECRLGAPGSSGANNAGLVKAGEVTTGHFQASGHTIAYERSHPSGSGRHPAVVLLHGAGGPVLEALYERPMIDSLTAHGYVVNAVHYFDGTDDAAQDPNNFVQWVHTIIAAITDLARDPTVDTTRIGIMGISLGGSLTLAVASSDQRVNAGVDISGPIPPLFGGSRIPPMLLLHGLADDIIPVDQAYALDTLFTTKGVEHELKLYEGQGHMFKGSAYIDAIQRTVRFFDTHLTRAGAH